MRGSVYGWILLAVLLMQGVDAVQAAPAFGQTGDYRNCWPALDVETESNVSVMVFDKRPYFLSGEKKGTFVGLSRSGFGIPYDIQTASELPLARDLEEAIVNGFSTAAIVASSVSSTEEFSRNASDELNKLLVVTINEWKSDTYKLTSFEYNVSAVVYDSKGRVLGSNSVSGKKEYSSGVDGGRATLTTLLTGLSIEQALTRELLMNSSAQEPEPSEEPENIPQSSTDDMYSELRKLKDLLDDGILTQEEFDAQKKKVLAR